MNDIVKLLAAQGGNAPVKESTPVVSALLGGKPWTGLAPFDPQVNTPRDNGDGTFSTEIEITNGSPDGMVWNIPTLWFGPDGVPRELPPEAAQSLAHRYEQATGKMFPRFQSIDEAVAAAKARSAAGGASNHRLAK